MIDREKIINAIEKAKKQSEENAQDAIIVPFKEVDMIISLLKEQEAKPMTEYDDGWDCPRCGLKLIGKTASGYPCDEFDLP